MLKIPLLSIPDKPIVSSTQDFIPIADIVDGIVLFKNGGAALIMESTSRNFELLSEGEQLSVIAGYAGLLNSFNFPVQIVVRSQIKDISNYMDYLMSEGKKITNPKLAHIMEDYRRFIVDVIKKKNVLSKKFYIVIPFSPYELGVSKSFMSTFGPRHGALPFPKSYVVRKAKITLFPKRDHLLKQAGRLGVEFKPLGNDELINLVYNVYNPELNVKEEEKTLDII